METVQKNIEIILILIGLFLTLDDTICGYFGIRTGDTSRMPKTIAYLFLKLLENGSKKYKGNDKKILNFYSFKAYCYYFFLGGILYFILFLFCLVEKLII